VSKSVEKHLDWLFWSLSYPWAWMHALRVCRDDGRHVGLVADLLDNLAQDPLKQAIYNEFCLKIPQKLYPIGAPDKKNLFDSWQVIVSTAQIKNMVDVSAAALIFYEDPEQYLSMTGSEIAVWTSLADNQCPPARLLRPMVVTNEHFVKVGLPGYQLSENTAL
jgi:hypothetical protein